MKISQVASSILCTAGFLTLSLGLTGCLVTRQEVRGGAPGRSEPLSAEQQRGADTAVRLQDVEEQMRALTGRVETVENGLNVASAEKSGLRSEQQSERKALQDRLSIFEEEFAKMQTQYLALAQQVEALRQAYDNEIASRRSSGGGAKGSSSKNDFENANADYAKKSWKEAIVGFEKYRSANPNGKSYAQATFKIGAAFHELGMKSEARAFYSEVVEKFPKSDWAKQAQQRLKALK